MPLAPELLQDASRVEFSVSSAQLSMGLIAAAVAGVCVLFHYEALSVLSRLLSGMKWRRRARIVVAILWILGAHVVEVWIFGLAYWFLDGFPRFGRLPGPFLEGALDFIYFSVVTFTTLGYGDIVPQGSIRILAGTEALLGLTLITWSASFTFLEMQRDWGEFRRGTRG